ncbi:MAG: flagellar assembly protein FliX [Methylobacterium sp.]|uniref:flagellar assembly protein FliX n=1 Tax=Methylobacterium sp. TaxID=409 RepID=UPI0025FA903C|nr:flagellar assembly protein FliX [Methylobacterium sp.]MBX9932322.1 flagellar assembly protein FliX [Methylobacterium sp.]
MRVDTRFVAQAAGPAASGRRPEAATAFALEHHSAAAAAAGSPAAASLAGLDAILTLQGQSETPKERRRRSAQRGHELLDGLDRLKASLLSGKVSTRDLQAIAGRLSDRAGLSGDPRLDGLVADIELRAAVELAKLQVGQGGGRA